MEVAKQPFALPPIPNLPPPPPLTFPPKRVTRREKEQRLDQKGHVLWLYGLSGSGKSTLAVALERTLAGQGILTTLLDGDEIRAGLNRGLGFSDTDRTENLRRVAEVARLFAHSGSVVVCAFITPLRDQRILVREIIGGYDLTMVYLSASFAACARRDPKGLYARAAGDKIAMFTGRDSTFEQPSPGPGLFILDTDTETPALSLTGLQAIIEPRIRPVR